MKTAITDNSEIISTLITIVVGGIIRAIEKRRLRKKGIVNDYENR